MFEEILENLEQADVKDFTDCLLENLRDPVKERRYRMFVFFKNEEPASWKSLTKGCRAAALVFMHLFEFSEAQK